MATNSKTTTTGGMPSASDLGNQIATNLASADSTAAGRAQALAWVHRARAAQLSRTAANLKAQYGANDAGVKAAEAAASAANHDAARAAVAHQQVATPEPQIATKGWALHGRVFDAQLAPLFGHTVFLVDSSKAYQQAYGYAYTDDTGYFLLNYAGSDATSKSPGTAERSSATTDQSAAATELYVAVVDDKAQPVHLGTDPFQPVLGSAIYQNIVLLNAKQPIGDPPLQIRNVSFPPSSPKGKKKR